MNSMTITEEIERFAFHQTPLFVVGMERSGTSILTKIISSHSKFEGVRYDNETFVLTKDSDFFDQPIDMTTRYIGGPSAWEDFEKWFPSIDNWPKRWSAKKCFVLSYFFWAHRSLNFRHIIEKTPSHVFHVDEIFEFFPQAKVIGIVRHPFTVITSFQKRLVREKKAGNPVESWSWLDRTPEQICERCKNVHYEIDEMRKRYGLNSALISYEQLTSEPELALSQISTFLGLDNFKVSFSDGAEKSKDSSVSVDPLLEMEDLVIGRQATSELPLETKLHLTKKFPDFIGKFTNSRFP